MNVENMNGIKDDLWSTFLINGLDGKNEWTCVVHGIPKQIVTKRNKMVFMRWHPSKKHTEDGTIQDVF